MKKIYFFTAFLFLLIHLSGQKIDMPIDKIKFLLCKKWIQQPYALYENKKVHLAKGSVITCYEFKTDNTVIYYNVGDVHRYAAIWKYDSENKILRFGKDGGYDRVLSLSETELKTQPKWKSVTSPVIFIFKIMK